MDNDFDKILGSPAEQGRDWQRFGLSHNPFPSRAHPIWDVFYNQEAVRDTFLTELKVFIADGSTRTMLLTGGNRIGKTHFMEHYRRRLPDEFKTRKVVCPIVLLTAQSGDFPHFYRQFIDQVDDCLMQQTGSGLFQHVPPTSVPIPERFPPGDLQRALKRLLSASDKDRPDVILWLRKWVRGERLRMPQRNLLDVSSSLDSSGQMLNTLGGLIKYLRSLGAGQPVLRCPGVMVLLDEFELVWKYRRDRRDQFLHILRELVDSCETGLFLCIGMATGLGVETSDVEAEYPALFARLRGSSHRKIPALVQVGSVLDALGYAQAFIEHGRQEHDRRKQGSKAKLPPPLGDGDLLTRKDIESCFTELAGSRRSVAQGDFFDRLHEEAELRVRPARAP